MGSLFGASLALLAGYAYVYTSVDRRFTCEHLRTDRFALHLLAYSFVFYGLGAVGSELLPYWSFDLALRLQKDASEYGIGPVQINALIFAFIAGKLHNYKRAWNLRRENLGDSTPEKLSGQTRLAAQLRYVRKCADANLRLILRAVLLNRPVLVTLKSNKVYVGRFKAFPHFDPAHPLTNINLFPYFSGYRDKDTRELIITTNYRDLYNELTQTAPIDPDKPVRSISDILTEDVRLLKQPAGAAEVRIDVDDMGVVIALSEVAVLSLYDENIFRWFNGRPKEGAAPLDNAEAD